MCDAYSLASAGSDLLGGIGGSMVAKSAANLEAAQIDAQKTLIAADLKRDEGKLRRSFSDMARKNIAAAAVSGLDMASFSGVMDGNEAELQRALAEGKQAATTTQKSLEIKKALALAEGKARASAALWGGISSGLSTVHDAERSYQKTNTGESRLEAFLKSIGRK